MSATLQRDVNSQPVQSLQPVSPTSVSISGTSQLLAIPANTKFFRMAATGAVWFDIGTSSVVATTSSLLFPPGVDVFPVSEGATHVAV